MVVGSGRRARTAPHIVLFDHAQPQAGRDTLKEFADDERAYETANAWVPWLQLARAAHWRMRGDYAAARAEYANCLQNHDSAASTRGQFWPKATAGMIETLSELAEFQEARLLGETALAECEQHGIGMLSHGIARALALVEGRLEAYDQAARRIERVIAEQLAYGVAGLQLGASYEARARIGIWAADADAIEKFGRLTAQVYRHGR
ncbi:MAG: hypothetical protein RL701_5608, partial [Pseudomonadota bacterium]